MVLEYIKENFDTNIPSPTVEDIAKIIKTDETGTELDDVSKINEKLLKATLSVKFEPKYLCALREIEDEIGEGKPVIVWVWLSDDRGGGCGHSVVITDINRLEGVIGYNDPIFGEREEEIGTFMSRWDNININRILIKVKIEKRPQRLIPEYAERKVEEESSS